MSVRQNSQVVINIDEIKVASHEQKLTTVPVVAWCSANWRAIVSEGFCTCLLVVLGCMSCIPTVEVPQLSLLYIPLGFGFAATTIIQIFGHISGAYMSPAVALATVIWGRSSIPLGIAFLIAQILGAIIGYGILIVFAPVDMQGNGICLPEQHPALSGFQLVGVEFILTAILVLICCSFWDPANEHLQDSAPLKFGLVVAGLSISGGPLTGAVLNPARLFGPALWSGIWTYHWVYWVGPLSGSATATILYKFTFIQKSTR